MEGARRATGISPGNPSPSTITVILLYIFGRIKMSLETVLLTDLNRSKVLTQPLPLGLTCMTHSLVFHALDGFTFLICGNSKFELLSQH
jgi:hypothetical protein